VTELSQSPPAALPDHLPSRRIGSIAITSRPLAVYRDMFALTDDDLLAGPILDCPGGASSFGAEVRARGGRVVSADPLYVYPPELLAGRVRDDRDRAYAWVAANPRLFVSHWIDPSAPWRLDWQAAGERFLIDYATGGPYLAAELPRLPFVDRAFALAVSSHLLFCYAEYLPHPLHVDALVELARVARQARVFPLLDTANTPYPRLDDLRADLADRGVATEVRTVAHEMHRGGNQMLVCWRES
jgi:hypothetical protein